jgi:CBS domain-containing protein
MTTIAEVMTRDVRVVAPDTTLQQAAQVMKDRDIGSLPVCNGKRLIGMVTDRDMAVRGIANGLSPQSTPVRDVMTQDVEYVSDTDSIDDVQRKMGGDQIRRVPVVDAQHDLVGIVSLGDLATNDARGTDKTLKQISEPGGKH